jgi:hypothetical protein
MKTKPGLRLWLLWFAAYTAIDIIVDYFIHGSLQPSQLPADIEGAAFAALLTWLFALRRWSKSDSLF